MRLSKSILILAVFLGLTWFREKLRSIYHSPHETHLQDNELDKSNSNSSLNPDTHSLNYALHKMRDQSTERRSASVSREPASVAPHATAENHESSNFLSVLKALQNHPDAFSEALEGRLSALGSSRIQERTVLMQEMFLVLNHESQPDLLRLLNEEKNWLANNIQNISDKTALHNHIYTLVRMTARTQDHSQERFNSLKSLAIQLKRDAYALRSFRYALVESSEWDITDIFENIPEDLKLYLLGKKR